MPLTSPPPIPQRGDPATFSDRVDAFLTWEGNTLVPELNALEANLSSIAAGGAYAIPYTIQAFGNIAAVGAAAGGQMAFQGDGARLFLDTKSAAGQNVAGLLAAMGSSTSAIKGTLKITKMNDSSLWTVYNILAYAQNSGGLYGYFDVVAVGSSGVIPPLSSVILQLQRTGDKGDSGNATPVIYVRNQLGNGTAPQTFLANTWNVVQLNNIPYSTISGVTVNSNGIINSLPAGTYWVEGSSPVLAGGTNQVRLFNVTDATVIDNGTSDRSDTGTPLRVTRSFIRTAFTISAPKAIRMEHWVSQQTTNGSPASSGAGEIYGEIRLLKVA